MTDNERMATAALRSFPLPSTIETAETNYRRILAWLHDGKSSPAKLIIELGGTS